MSFESISDYVNKDGIPIQKISSKPKNPTTFTEVLCSSISWFLSIMIPITLGAHVGTTNNLLTEGMVDVSLPWVARLNCLFLSEFTGTSRCTVQYGTDPTYMNLPYSAESTETGTAGDSVSVELRERLNSLTVYYYTVSAVSGDITVTVLASPFTTPQYSKQLHILYVFIRELVDWRWTCNIWNT